MALLAGKLADPFGDVPVRFTVLELDFRALFGIGGDGIANREIRVDVERSV